jgi:glycine betaine/proline transport system substrate-binding protein
VKSSTKIKLVTIDLSFHRAASAIAQAVLMRHDITVHETFAPHEQAFELLESGAADMLCSAWLPSSHGVYFEAIADRFEKLSVLYRPYALWGAPDYIPADAVRSIHDLRKPEVASQMTKLIQGIGPGAGISRFSKEIIQQYRLGEHGYEFRNGTLDDCVGAFEAAVRNRRWIVTPLWRPQFLHEKHAIRELEDPLKLLGQTDDATLIVSKNLLSMLPHEAVEELRRTRIGNEEVSRVDYLISREGMTPTDAALTLPRRTAQY